MPSIRVSFTVRGEHDELEAREKALFKSIDAGRAEVARVEKEIERLTHQREQMQEELVGTDTKLKAEQSKKDNADRNINSQVKLLPAPCQAQATAVGLKELATLTDEQKHLQQEGTDDRGRASVREHHRRA